jgi:hypothetical protein
VHLCVCLKGAKEDDNTNNEVLHKLQRLGFMLYERHMHDSEDI